MTKDVKALKVNTDFNSMQVPVLKKTNKTKNYYD